MELWIRSQNKETFVKVNAVFVTNYCKEIVTIRCYIDNDGSIWLGTYKSKERALEILDEIQNYICPNGSINLYDGTRVYEMPKE